MWQIMGSAGLPSLGAPTGDWGIGGRSLRSRRMFNVYSVNVVHYLDVFFCVLECAVCFQSSLCNAFVIVSCMYNVLGL